MEHLREPVLFEECSHPVVAGMFRELLRRRCELQSENGHERRVEIELCGRSAISSRKNETVTQKLLEKYFLSNIF
jgi:hypothetical protein